MAKIEMLGRKFGRLTVIAETQERYQRGYCYICRCDCGRTTPPIRGTLLRNGNTKSCGCLQPDTVRANNYKHGMIHDKIYFVWAGMKDRCFNPKHNRYHRYGGRGITVCEEWSEDFQQFYKYVSSLPHFGEAGYSLDRIDNDGNYEPGNVRWADAKTQASNRPPCAKQQKNFITRKE